MPNQNELLEQIKNLIFPIKGIVSCPPEPAIIPDIGAGAEGALDAMGTLFTINVPKAGILYSATYYDMDFEGTQVNLYLFNHQVTAIADNAAWTCSDADLPNLVAKLAFVSPDTHGTAGYTFQLTNIGKAYTAPEGKLWIQAQCVAICTIAVTPRFQFQIISYDPNFEGR